MARLSQNLRVVMVATHAAGWVEALKVGCTRAGITLDVLGDGLAWTGFSMKLRLLSKYLETIEDDNTLIFVVDAFDVLCLVPSAQALQLAFESFGTDLVLSEDARPVSVLGVYGRSRAFGPTHNDIWLNSGAYAGRVHAIKNLMALWYPRDTRHVVNDEDDDQRALHRTFLRDHMFFETHASVDVHKTLFFTASYADMSQIVAKGPGSVPAFVHAPGNVDMTSVAVAYDLPLHVHKPIGFTAYIYRNKLYRHLPRFIPEIVAGMLLICGIVLGIRGMPKSCRLHHVSDMV
jgi:hypothetical protein